MNLSRIYIPLGFLIAIGLTACSAETSPQPGPTATPVAAGQLTDPEPATTEAIALVPTFTLTPSPSPTATNTPLPPTATVTPTPSPEPDPVLKVDDTLTSKINVRTGPGTYYPIITQFEPGQEALVVGRIKDESWWQVTLPKAGEPEATGWVFGELVTLAGNLEAVAIVEPAPPSLPQKLAPGPTAVAEAEVNPEEAAQAEASDDGAPEPGSNDKPSTPEELAEQLRCGKDFCVTYQAMVPIGENGGCIGNHSIYITVLEGLPPGKPLDGVVIGDTFNNVEVGSGSHGPGRTEITLWMNSMTLYVKRNQDGTPYTSEESFNFTAHDELIPAEVLAANGYCDGSVEKCRWAQQNNQICRGHYSWRVTFHKFD